MFPGGRGGGTVYPSAEVWTGGEGWETGEPSRKASVLGTSPLHMLRKCWELGIPMSLLGKSFYYKWAVVSDKIKHGSQTGSGGF